MPKIFTTILKLALALVVLVLIIAVGAFYTFDPNKYKPELEEAVLSSTGFELNIAGDIGFSLRPYVGVSLNDVRVKNPDFPQELASSSSIALKVDIGQLFGGTLAIEEFSSDDFHINLITNAEGKSIWETVELAGDTDTTAVAASDGDSGSSISAQIKQFTISNASVDFQDLSAGSHYKLQNLNISSSDSNIDGRAFPLRTTLDFIDGINDPISLGLNAVVRVDTELGEADLADIELNFTPVLLQGNLRVRNMNSEPTFSGDLESNTFRLSDLMDSLGASSQDSNTAAAANNANDQQVRMAMAFSGDANQLELPSAVITLGATRVDMNASVRLASDIAPTSVRYEIKTNGVDLTPFMATEDTAAVAQSAAPATNGNAATAAATANSPASNQQAAVPTPLPFELLNAFNVVGSIAIESLKAGDIQLGAINVLTNVENGVLDIETQPITAFQGQIGGNMHIDARSSNAVIETTLSATQLSVIDLALSIPDLKSVTGQLDMDTNYTASGNTVDDVLNSLVGSTTFAITDNSVDIGLVKQIFTAIAALSPTGETIQQWPDVIQFSDLNGYIVLNNGIGEGQEIKVRMDNVDISGVGGVDLAASAFDYDFEFTILGEPAKQTIQIDQLYHDVSWPVQCVSQFEAEVSQYCSPDFSKVRDIFAQMATNEVKRRVQDEITERLPEGIQDSARSLLRGLLN